MATKEPIRHAGFLIRKLPGAGRACPYQVDLRACKLPEGENNRPCFATMKEAKAKAAEMREQVSERGQAAFDLSERDRLDAKDALAALAGRCTMAEAARFWAKYHPDAGAVTFNDLLAKYRAHQVAMKVRPATLNGLARLVKVGRTLGERPVQAILPEDLAGWLDGRGLATVNRNNYRRSLAGLFNYAVREGIVSSNPLARVVVVKVEAAPITFWTAEQVRLLLHTAEELKADMVPMLAVMAFAGLRPAEAEGLRWESVNLAEKIIRVEGTTSKTRDRRVVPICDTLAAWLVKYRGRGPVAPPPEARRYWRTRIAAATVVTDWRERLAKQDGMKGTAIAAAGLNWATIIAEAKKARGRLWPHDILRHTFASNWLATHYDENKLASNMGNSPDIIHKHYRAVVTEAEAAAYWSIRPSAAGKMIPMRATA